MTIDRPLTLLDTETSCVFLLPSPPSVPDVVSVTVNGATVPRDPSHLLGWDYTDTRLTTVVLFGAWCDTFVSSQTATISIYYGCP